MRACLGLAVLAVACSGGVTTDGPVHTLTLPAEHVDLPDAPGRLPVESTCAGCHSLRYVLDQPPLSRKVWQAEVDKMRTAFGAPVPDDDAASIVDYLARVHGDGS